MVLLINNVLYNNLINLILTYLIMDDIPRRHSSMPRDHNIFNLDRSYVKNECNAIRLSEKSVDKLLMVK